MTTSRLQAAGMALAVLALLAILYPEPLLQGQVYLSADAQNSDALRQVGDAGRERGSYPFWNPYLFLGMPTFGSLAYTPGLYPPSVLLEFLHAGLGWPPLTWLLAHLLFGGLGMAWLLGRWRLPFAARLLGAIAWLGFAGTVAWAVHGHGSKLGAAMYMPWLVGLAWEVLTRGSLRAAALAGVLLGLQVLRGHVQITYYTLLLLGGLALWHLLWPLEPGEGASRQARARRAAWLGAAVALGLAVGAVMLLPVREYAQISTRGQGDAGGGAGFAYATAWSLGARELSTLVQPGAAGFGRATYHGPMPFTDYPNYFGWLWLALAATAAAAGRRSLAAALGAAVALSLLVALGDQSPGLYQALYAALPYFDKFRVPSMILVVAALAAAALAAHGAAALAATGPTSDRARRWAGLALGAIGAVTFLTAAAGVGAGSYRDALASLAAASGKPTAPALLEEAWRLHRGFLVREGLILLAAAGAVLVAQRRARLRRHLPWALALLLAVDLLTVANLVTHPERGLLQVTADGRLAPAPALVRPYAGPRAHQVDPALADALRRATGHDRVYPLDERAQTNAFMTAGIRSLGGYYPAKPAAAEQVRRRLYGASASGGRVAAWLGAASVTLARELPDEAVPMLRAAGLDLEAAGRHGGTWVYRNRTFLPRARLADRWRPQSGGLEPLLDAIASGAHDPAAAVVLDRAPVPAPVAGAAPLPPVEYVEDGLDTVVLRARADRPVILVLADLMVPGWRASVDGRDAPLLLADGALRAVALPAGEHEVRFTFRDAAVGRGLAVTLAGLAGLAAIGALAWRRERTRAA